MDVKAHRDQAQTREVRRISGRLRRRWHVGQRSSSRGTSEKRMVHINCPCYRGLTASLEEKAKNGEGPKVAGGARIRDYDSVRDGLSLSQSLFRERQGGIRGRKDSR
ncbi:hypothetical protein BHE74_00006129 [Ensete ventricosum]|nr:hypothetical protein BHE74_00006129 [Ensete ventricosum]